MRLYGRSFFNAAWQRPSRDCGCHRWEWSRHQKRSVAYMTRHASPNPLQVALMPIQVSRRRQMSSSAKCLAMSSGNFYCYEVSLVPPPSLHYQISMSPTFSGRWRLSGQARPRLSTRSGTLRSLTVVGVRVSHLTRNVLRLDRGFRAHSHQHKSVHDVVVTE